MTNPIKRVPLSRPFTPGQKKVVARLGAGDTLAVIAKDLGLQYSGALWRMREAAARIPGNLPPKTRIVMWWRGASRKALGAE